MKIKNKLDYKAAKRIFTKLNSILTVAERQADKLSGCKDGVKELLEYLSIFDTSANYSTIEYLKQASKARSWRVFVGSVEIALTYFNATYTRLCEAEDRVKKEGFIIPDGATHYSNECKAFYKVTSGKVLLWLGGEWNTIPYVQIAPDTVGLWLLRKELGMYSLYRTNAVGRIVTGRSGIINKGEAEKLVEDCNNKIVGV